MGINGLLPLLKPIHNQTHVKEFAGKTIAVDGYVWLHRAAYSCAMDLVKGKRTSKYVDYVMHRVRLLRHHKIQPYMVFDGGPLPAKNGTEVERRKRREENLKQARELEARGKHSEARDYYVKCLDITPQMAYQVIKALKAEGVPYVVAPYEADAQMTYLEASGLVDGIMTEDSDLLVFGAKLVLFKFDTSGSVVAISRTDFGQIHTPAVSFVGWSDIQFREMAILSGCDYLPSIQGIGIITAAKLMRKHKSAPKVLQFLRLEGTKRIPKGYLEDLRTAELAFQYQRVYDPRSKRLVHLREPPEDLIWDETKDGYVGTDMDPVIAKGIAEGDIDPSTYEPMDDINPAFNPAGKHSTPRPCEPLRESIKSNTSATPRSEPQKGIMDFFTPKNKSIGTASGKTSLVEVMEYDLSIKPKPERAAMEYVSTPHTPKRSRFFASGIQTTMTSVRLSPMKKFAKRARESVEPSTPRKTKVQKECESLPGSDAETDTEEAVVQQEHGYMSPLSDSSRHSWASAARMTSPIQERIDKERDNDDCVLSSPIASITLGPSARRGRAISLFLPPSKEKEEDELRAPSFLSLREPAAIEGPNLQDMFQDDVLLSPAEQEQHLQDEEEQLPSPARTELIQEDDLEEFVTEEEERSIFMHKQISEGWKTAYSFQSSSSRTTFLANTNKQARSFSESSPASALPRRHSAPFKQQSKSSPFLPHLPARPRKSMPLPKTPANPIGRTSSGLAMEAISYQSRPTTPAPTNTTRLSAFRFQS